ncbi:transcription elongation factor GreA [candidate division WWE3 bacterium RIFCSPHIGHO2_12_FULL_38_15]|uniref:Transcription elongation factor GreA n=1 Tax=candidate division WWE3 bacterium RIFCSPHIGHO2_02_FULL_38_14 TaxID=1802620 RepID=A0A1F4V941_UNCKA|nr:MAG: transcription elongation factor GreA [candidate division WWE3 bacterium RIFCSPHIGHO2_01_FULL_38_45]OGC48339.1 MAG: transcription elongation factor GreA [candidate division WWE3 bacterium RIFCSPHIGHO2_12_FULL_38_15]OGC53722.1 MAG: transcription elongation factor GreA [candidate division WWE3 bacterium RIFCSPHIGHO2_02_FULL_38_14]OGC54274.1 MAG: transcription elongation factor GreA [candidate division WWE3 bacterium RIFCSPLOWO2_01_FULL_37_24]HLB51517.1 transcription elongation factor GreA 
MNKAQKDNKYYVTAEGMLKLKDELKDLIDVKRYEVAKRIKQARDNGDISENAEYDAARQEQSFVEGRISELEDILKNVVVSDVRDKSKVFVGAKVTVHVDGEEESFYIVGAPEANPMEKKISHESPLGSCLIGKKIGDKILVEAPVGSITYTILNIE